MKEIKAIFIGLYSAIGFMFAIYGSYFGDYQHKGVAWNVGKAIVWPTIVFPALGQAIGGLIIIGLVLRFIVFPPDKY